MHVNDDDADSDNGSGIDGDGNLGDHDSDDSSTDGDTKDSSERGRHPDGRHHPSSSGSRTKARFPSVPESAIIAHVAAFCQSQLPLHFRLLDVSNSRK